MQIKTKYDSIYKKLIQEVQNLDWTSKPKLLKTPTSNELIGKIGNDEISFSWREPSTSVGPLWSFNGIYISDIRILFDKTWKKLQDQDHGSTSEDWIQFAKGDFFDDDLQQENIKEFQEAIEFIKKRFKSASKTNLIERPDYLKYEDDNDIIEVKPASWKIVITEKDSDNIFDDEFETKEEAIQAMKKEIETLKEEYISDEFQASKTAGHIDLKKIQQDIKTDLNKLYARMNLSGRFNSDAFSIKQEDNKILVDIPYLSTSKNEIFLNKMNDSSKEIILKYLKKNGIENKKSDFKYEGKSKGYFSASTYSLENTKENVRYD